MNRLVRFLSNSTSLFHNPVKTFTLPRWLILSCKIATTFFVLCYLALYCIVANHAHKILTNPPLQKADAALILGNRAYLYNKSDKHPYMNSEPNPCLLGRVDKGIALSRQGLVSTLVMSGGLDAEDDAIEAAAMEVFAINEGFAGRILLESRSSSTQENLEFSRPILQAAGIRKLIIVSEPYHMWRTEKLVEAGHLGQDFEVSYAAAASQCWMDWGMLFKGALREPLAIMHNFAKGYF